jgi:hypothetical protein
MNDEYDYHSFNFDDDLEDMFCACLLCEMQDFYAVGTVEDGLTPPV